MRKSLSVLLILVLLSISSCSNWGDSAAALNYTLEEKNYTHEDNISLKYPTIVCDDKKFSEKNNELILEHIEKYLEERIDNIDNFTLDINYEVKEKTNEMLSILFYGSMYVKYAAHPSSIVFTINLGLKNEVRLKISDFTDNMDGIADVLLDDTNNTENHISSSQTTLNYLRNEYSRVEILSELESADIGVGWQSFIQNGELGIVVLLPHVMGGYGLIMTGVLSHGTIGDG